MASVASSGSQTATLNTEHSLATVTTAGSYQLVVDTANMQNGDRIEVRIYGKARSGDTERLAYRFAVYHAQSENLKFSIPVASPHHFKATLEQVEGTGRAFPWAVYSL